MKFGLLILFLIAVLLWFSHAKRHQRDKRTQSGATTSSSPAASANSESIVGCSHCGLHVPVSDAVVSASGASFCSEAHHSLHPDA